MQHVTKSSIIKYSYPPMCPVFSKLMTDNAQRVSVSKGFNAMI